MENIFKNFQFKAQNYIIKRSDTIKILGTYIQKDLRLDREIMNLSSQLHNRIFNLRKIQKYTDFQTRLSFINSFVIGKLNYMLPLYTNAPNYLINKLHKVIMTGARAAIGNYCFRKSFNYILEKCNWLNIENMVLYAGVCFTHKMLIKRESKSILTLYKTNFSARVATKTFTFYQPKQIVMKNFHVYKCLEIYNNILPKEIKSAKMASFKKKLKTYLSTHTVTFDSNDWHGSYTCSWKHWSMGLAVTMFHLWWLVYMYDLRKYSTKILVIWCVNTLSTYCILHQL